MAERSALEIQKRKEGRKTRLVMRFPCGAFASVLCANKNEADHVANQRAAEHVQCCMPHPDVIEREGDG